MLGNQVGEAEYTFIALVHYNIYQMLAKKFDPA